MNTKYKKIIVEIGIILVIVLLFVLSYSMNWIGAFQHDVTLNGDGYFSINMPGNYKTETTTLGTADLPLFRKIYTYDNNAENNRIVFTVIEDNFPAQFSDKQIYDLFIQSPESELIQNSGSNYTGPKEAIQEKTAGTYAGYPSIDVTIKVENTSVIGHVRYIKIGHIIYKINMSNDGCSGNECKDFFNRYANTFKILLNDKLKTR